MAALEAEVQHICDTSRGGLCEALVFLEEIDAFLFDTTDMSDSGDATNLSAELRRMFDQAFAEDLHLVRSVLVTGASRV